MMYDIVDPIKEELDNKIDVLLKEALDLKKSQRKKRVEEITEWYYNETGRYPDSYRLTKLANVMLIEEIKDRRKNKSKLTEYSFHSPRQEKTREQKEIFVETDADLDFLHQKVNKNMSSAFKKRTSERSLND